jgi:Flp pilus assembly protein TadD
VVNGFFVSDRASPVLFDPETLARSPALTWPPELADGVRIVGRRLGSPPYEEVARYLRVSRAEFDASVKLGKGLEDPITGFQRILGSTAVYAKTALDLWDKKRPSLLMVYFEGTDEVGHLLARYHPPKLAVVSDADFARYSQGVSLYYRECDRILGELAKRAKESGADLVLVSDHGFKWGSDRPAEFSSGATETAYLWHDPYGVFVAAGPGVAPSKERGTVDVMDVVPLLCRLLALPLDPRMKGSVPKGFLSPAAPKPVPAASWEKAAPVKRAAAVRETAAEKKLGEEFTKKLISLGYLSGAPSAAGIATDGGSSEVQMTPYAVSNLGVYVAEQGRDLDAVPYFRRAIAAAPEVATFRWNLGDALERLGRFAESDAEIVKGTTLEHGDATRLMGCALRRVRAKKVEEARALLEKAANDLSPAPFAVRDGLGRLDFDTHRCREAADLFERLSRERPGEPGSWVMLARSRRCLGDVPGAREAVGRALALAPDLEPAKREAAALGSASP